MSDKLNKKDNHVDYRKYTKMSEISRNSSQKVLTCVYCEDAWNNLDKFYSKKSSIKCFLPFVIYSHTYKYNLRH